jgi:hypothetical protein
MSRRSCYLWALQAVNGASKGVSSDVSPKRPASPVFSERICARLRLAPALLTVALLSAPAWAAPSEADRATARSLADKGQAALERHDYRVAYDCFSGADALFHAPTLLLGLARAQAGLGALVNAGETYQRLVSEVVTPKSPRPFIEAVESGKKELERLKARIPNVIIQVTGAANAEVTLDGSLVPRDTLGVKRPVDPGPHVVRAEAGGLGAGPVTVTVEEGQTTKVTLELKPVRQPAQAKPVGSAPADSAPAGSAPAGSAPAGSAPASKGAPSGLWRTLSIAAFGVGGTGVVLSGITGSLALVAHNKLASQCGGGTCPPSQEDELKKFHTLATVATIGFVAGSVSLAAGGILFFTAPKAKQSEVAGTRRTSRSSSRVELSVVPRVGAGYVGVEGKF